MLRPMVNQLVKTQTRGGEFNFEKYSYDVLIRAATFNIEFGKISMSMSGSEFSLIISKSIFRGFLSGFGKKYIY